MEKKNFRDLRARPAQLGVGNCHQSEAGFSRAKKKEWVLGLIQPESGRDVDCRHEVECILSYPFPRTLTMAKWFASPALLFWFHWLVASAIEVNKVTLVTGGQAQRFLDAARVTRNSPFRVKEYANYISQM